MLNSICDFFGSSQKKNKTSAYSRRLELLGLEERITPSNFTVSSLDNSGEGSLRQAILNAKASDNAPDTINISVLGTITLQSSLPTIEFASTKGALTITGLTPSFLTITGNNSDFNFFNIDPSGDLTISGVTVSGANSFSLSGGAFYNLGNLSISNANISNNFGKNSGGAIFNDGTLTIANSTLSGNSTESLGGAIFNQSSKTLTIANSTLSGNIAFVDGGAIYNRGTLNLSNSTLASNDARNSGGALFNDGTLNIANTILANSTKNGSSTNSSDYSGAGTVTLLGSSTNANNLVTKGTFAWATTVTSLALDLSSTLDNNGGPTKTLALGENSVAKTAGSASVSNASPINGVDQRGFIRSATTPSIGAFEFNGISPAPTVTSISPSSGASTGGTLITITGTNFTGAYSVTIGSVLGGASATNVTVVSPTTITATTPAGTVGTASVEVTNNYGTNVGNSLFTYIGAANTPAFGTPAPTANGFTVQISNYNNAFTYAGTATAGGAVAISGTGLVTVTGVAANTSSIATITTTRTNYVSGSAQVTATSLNAANTPTFGTTTPTANGFTVQISNFDAAFTYAGTATASGTVAISGTGLVTVTGVAANTSSTATITTTRANYATGSATVTATSLNAANTPTFGTTTPTVSGFTVQISNYDAAFSYAGSATASGTVAINGTGLVTVTGVAANTSSIATITTTRANYVTGSATVTATSLAPPTVANISPASGLFTGGTAITITGTHLTGATAVTIGGVAATNVIVVNSTTITATTPAGTVGTASVLVTTPGGNNTANTLFTYLNATTVTTTADTVNPGDGVISLREAIINANATLGNDQINFNLTGSSPYTITLGSALPSIQSASTAGTLVINGLGAFVLTISGNNSDVNRNFRIFNIDSGADLTLSGVTVSGGKVTNNGGAFNNAGTLTIANSILAGNSATGADGTGSSLNGFGGAIFNSGTLTISNSTFSGNDATSGTGKSISGNGYGGAIFNSGTLTISNSTFSGNDATGFGGFVSGLGRGGAIDNSGTLTISNSTFSGNDATSGHGRGGAIGNSGTLTISNSTFSGNNAIGYLPQTSRGGAIDNEGTLKISNTILADSTLGGDFGGSAPATSTNNLVEDGSLPGTGEIIGDPRLGPLQFNGGLTFTMALGAGSPAIGAGDATTSNASPIFGLDQRGFNRSPTMPSIGAVDYYSVQPFPSAPTVASVSPASGPITGGTNITITGANLAGAYGVTIGGNVATHVTVVSPTSITVTTPAGAAGSASVLVATLGGGVSTANTLFTYVGVANTPTFGTATSTVNGFTVQISNYDAAFTYAGTVTAGTVAISNTGLVTVTGLAANTSSTATITTTRTNYANGSSQVTSTSLNPANTPSFGTPTSTANGFTVEISNYDGAFSYAGSATANGTVAINGTGLITVIGVAANTSSTVTITTSRTNHASGSATVTATSLVATVPLVTGNTGSTSGGSSSGSSTITISNSDGTKKDIVPFVGFTGEIRVNTGDFNNDGKAEIVVAAGPGGGPAISILDSETGVARTAFFAYNQDFRGGVFVVLKDFNNDGVMDIITGAGTGGGPHVKVFNGINLQEIASFFAYAETFTGGVSVAAADFNSDGKLDIVTGAGPGGGSHVKIFDGATIGNSNPKTLSEWFAYDLNFRGGVFIAAGDLDNNGSFEVVTGMGEGDKPTVAVWNSNGKELGRFNAFDELFRGGVRVGVFDGNNDGTTDLVTAAGPGGSPEVRLFKFNRLDPIPFELVSSFLSGDPNNKNGVNV